MSGSCLYCYGRVKSNGCRCLVAKLSGFAHCGGSCRVWQWRRAYTPGVVTLLAEVLRYCRRLKQDNRVSSALHFNLWCRCIYTYMHAYAQSLLFSWIRTFCSVRNKARFSHACVKNQPCSKSLPVNLTGTLLIASTPQCYRLHGSPVVYPCYCFQCR